VEQANLEQKWHKKKFQKTGPYSGVT